MLPNFIIIGAMKSGTSSLYRYLNMHPEIFMSKKKELDFFILEDNYSKGIKWYKSNFTSKAKTYGEASTGYSKYPKFKGVPQRMYAVLPNAKLIYVLRDPIERIISHYMHNYIEGTENRDIHEVLSKPEDNHYVACSKYYMQLEQYLKYYSKENILIISTEELRNHRQATLKKVFRFLDIDDSFYSPEFSVVFHETSAKKKKDKIGRYLSKMKVERLAKSFLPYRFYQIYTKVTNHSVERPKLNRTLEERLIKHLKDDIKTLRKFTGKDFQGWSL